MVCKELAAAPVAEKLREVTSGWVLWRELHPNGIPAAVGMGVGVYS